MSCRTVGHLLWLGRETGAMSRRYASVLAVFLLVSGCSGGNGQSKPEASLAPSAPVDVRATVVEPATTIAAAAAQAPSTSGIVSTTYVPSTTLVQTTVTTLAVSSTTISSATVTTSTKILASTTVPIAAVVTTSTAAESDYNYLLDEANVLNHLRPENELCLRQELGDETLDALRTRPMKHNEAQRSLRCFGQPTVDPARPVEPGKPVDPARPVVPRKPVDPPINAGSSWEGPTICASHGVFLQPPAFGVAVGQPLADPTATVLDDGQIRLYAYAQGIGIVSAISIDGRTFSEEPGIRIPGTEAGQPRVVRLPDGRWRMYVSKVKEIVSFTSDDGLVFNRDPGDRLSARAAGLAAISSPAIIEYEPGHWRMYYSTLAIPGTGPGGKRSGSATSTDLLDWVVDPGWRLGEGSPHLVDSAEHPFPVAGDDGSISLFYGKFRASSDGPPDGLYRAVSTDGLTFTEETYTGLYFGNDPEVLSLPSGDRVIYYGDFDPAVGGKLLSAECSEW